MTETPQAIPDIAEQTMDLLEKLLKERENNPEEILQLASRSDLVKLEIVYSEIFFHLKYYVFWNVLTFSMHKLYTLMVIINCA